MSFAIGDDGAPIQPVTPEDWVKEKIIFLLSINKGEITNDPAYGADLIWFTHGLLDNRRIGNLETAVKISLAQYMPYVLVDRIDSVRKSSEGLLMFTLYYGLAEGYEDFVNIVIGG